MDNDKEIESITSNAALFALMDVLDDGLILSDIAGRVGYVNRVLKKHAELPEGTQFQFGLGHVDDWMARLSTMSEEKHTLLLFPDGELDCKVVENEDARLTLLQDGAELTLRIYHKLIEVENKHWILFIFRDETPESRLVSALSYQAAHDPLTTLINRTEFEARLTSVLEKSQQFHWVSCLLYLDLDQFKVINDTCGHAAGDQLLVQVSQSLNHCLREMDTLGRLGGDEFGVILERCQLQQGLQVAEKLRDVVESCRFQWENHTFPLSVSIGVVEVTGNSPSKIEMLSLADNACNLAKEAGRNQIKVYEASDAQVYARAGEMQWVSKITQALENDRYTLFCQPIIHMKSGQKDCEILIRMLDDNGIALPGTFIPAAERYNLMPSLDKWVIRRLLGTLNSQPDLQKKFNKFAVNLSGTSICSAGFAEYIEEQLGLSMVPPSLICFEITETAAVANLPIAIEFIKRLKALGCQFSLDDFGSGLSSFGYLKNLPVDYLKIDGSFVKDIDNDEIDLAMVKSINDIGHVMGLKTIAEFVENAQILHLLTLIKVDFAQGYYVGRPKPLTDYLSPN